MPRPTRAPMNLFRRFLPALAGLALLAGVASAQDYAYRHVPMILYVVGQPDWDKLSSGPGGARNLTVYADQQTAKDNARGAPVYRIHRHTLENTPDGLAFLKATEQARSDRTAAQKDVLELPLSDAAAFEATVVKHAKTGNSLGPVNPHWKTSGPHGYSTKPMKREYYPGETHDDYGRGTFYFPTEGQPGAVDFMSKFKVHFQKQPDGSVLLMQLDPNDRTGTKLRPIDTRGLHGSSAVKQDWNTCIWVMDAEGNFYVLAPEWLTGLAAQLGLSGINHSSIPAGHRVAGAGHMVIENGKLILIDNRSGHYAPSNTMTVQAISALERHKVDKTSYKVSFGNGATDHPGRTYIDMDPDAEEKIKKGEIDADNTPTEDGPDRKPGAEAEKLKPPADDEGVLKPDEKTPVPALEVDRRNQNTPPETPKLEAEKPVDPPTVAVIEALTDEITKTPVDQMDIAFMKKLYQMDPKAAKMIGQILGKPELSQKNFKMGELRKAMDLMVWKEILKVRGIQVEITNQGKSNGAKSDLDYTLYHLAEEAGISIKDLILEHTETWKKVHAGLSPEQFEIKVMNGDEFYPDWRNENISAAEHEVHIRRVLGELRSDPEKYKAPGGWRQQVVNRADRNGHTEILKYDPALDKPDVPIDKQIVRHSGLTRDVALLYKGVHPQYNHMNALGNLVENPAEYFNHTGDLAQDRIRRAKYFNRVINEGLGHLRFFANDYAALHAGKLPNGDPVSADIDKERMKLDYLRKTLGLLKDDTGKPLLSVADIERFKDIIDVSMQIELDKATAGGPEYDAKRAEYFKDYERKAETTITERIKDQKLEPDPKEFRSMVLGEQERLYEVDQRRVMAEAMLAGLRHSVARDLTPEGALRNRVRYDPATQKFVIDAEGAKKVAFERAAEVALFYELINSLDDADPEQMFMKKDMKKRALSTAPSQEMAELYGALDEVDKAEIDKFLRKDPGNKIQRTIDDLTRKQHQRALELLIEKKEAAIRLAKAKGVTVDPGAIAREIVRQHIMDSRMGLFGVDTREQLWKAIKAVGPQLGKDLKQGFHENASPLMFMSTAVNLIRAYQTGDNNTLTRTAYSESINYMPYYIQMPMLAADLLLKIKEGQYAAAVQQGALVYSLAKYPSMGNALLAYNIVSGSIEITRTHFVTKIDADMVEKALRGRPRDPQGRPLPDNVRARSSAYPDFTVKVGKGSAPGTPLFFGLYKNEKGLPRDPVIINGDRYSNGRVPEDDLSDAQLADSAGGEFAPEIIRELTTANLEVGSPQWRQKAWELKVKYGFDIPFYRRMAKVFNEKYQYIKFFDNWPNPYNPDILDECRDDVRRWYVTQPEGYKDELRGEFTFFYGDQTDKMQEMIARQCAVIFGSMKELANNAEKLNLENMQAFRKAMEDGFNAERALLAAQKAIQKEIQVREEKIAVSLDQKALELAHKHTTQFVMRYPFTYATEETPPNLQFDLRSIPTRVKQPDSIHLDQEVVGIREGAPSGWAPGKEYADKFKPDASGWIALRPVTADMKFTGHLIDADGKDVAQSTLTLPVVYYADTFSGNIGVRVYAMGEKGDSSLYGGAEVTIDKDTRVTDNLSGSVGFDKLKAGAHAIKVAPRSGDARHGPGAGAATLTDVLLSQDANGKEYASVTIKLPYIPEPKVADDKKDDPTGGTGGGTGGTGGKKPGDKGGAGGGGGGTGGDSTGVNKPGGPGSGPTVEEIINGLTPLTSKAEKARDDAKTACNYVAAAAAQEQLVAAAKGFLASSFPKGAPADVAKLAQGFDAELVALKKAATAEVTAKDRLREGLALVRAKKGEPALTALEAASNVPDLPGCLHDQIMTVYNELKADIEKRILIIDKAVDAANNKCDFAAARTFGEQVKAEDANLSWVVNELPRIVDLDKRQQAARTLAQQAEAKAQQAEQLAAAGNTAQAEALFNEAIQLATQAQAQAPACDKANFSVALTALTGRKTALTNPTIDQSLVLLLDTSGSMGSGGKMESAKQAATDAVKSIGPTTEVALLTYDGGCTGGWRVNVGFTTQRQSVIAAIAGLSPGGGTPTAPAIGFAHDYMEKNARSKSGQIVLMTDGQNDCGSITDAGTSLRKGNIPVRIDAVGFGLGTGSQAQNDLGALVAAAGNGNSYSANSSAELISAFRRAFITNQIKPRDPFVSGQAATRLAELFSAAVAFLKQNDMRGAIGQFKVAVDQFPTSPAAQFNASLAYEAGGQPLQALNHARKYLQLAPNAFDAGTVKERVTQLEAEQLQNPRAIYAPNDCSAMYRWAQREVRVAGSDAARKAKVYDIMTTAQRGDCAAAEKAFEGYGNQYGRRP